MKKVLLLILLVLSACAPQHILPIVSANPIEIVPRETMVYPTAEQVYVNPDKFVDFCAKVASEQITVFYSPDDSDGVVGRILFSNKVEVLRIHNEEWFYIYGLGIDSDFRKAPLAGWAHSSELKGIPCKK